MLHAYWATSRLANFNRTRTLREVIPTGARRSHPFSRFPHLGQTVNLGGFPRKILLYTRSQAAMSTETNTPNPSTLGADAIDEAIAKGIDFDGSPIPAEKLKYHVF